MDLVDTLDAFAVFIFVSLLFHLIALPINLAHIVAALLLREICIAAPAAAGPQLRDSTGSVSRNIFLFMTTCDSLALSFSALESDLQFHPVKIKSFVSGQIQSAAFVIGASESESLLDDCTTTGVGVGFVVAAAAVVPLSGPSAELNLRTKH